MRSLLWLSAAVFSIGSALGAEPPEASLLPLSFRAGPVTLLPFGFLDTIGVTRSATTRDGISTRLGSIPLNPMPGESLVSVRNSRLAIRGEMAVGPGTLSGYLETDFLNRPPQQPYRFRQYFGQYTIGAWDISAGQEWSLLRPGRIGISTITSMMHTRVADAGYHTGLLGYRNRQVRVVRRVGSWQAGVAFENGRDFVPKLVHDSRRLHWEITGVAGAAGHHGASAAAVVHVGKNVDVVTQQSWIRNGGKDMLNAVPAGVASGASLVGAEAKLRAGFQAYAYAGLIYAARSTGNREVREWTLGFSHTLVRDALGPAVVNVQVSQLDRELWTGAHGAMRFSMISIRHYLGTPQ